MTAAESSIPKLGSNNSIVIFAFSRAELLRECISSTINAEGSAGWNKILVHQLGHRDVEDVVSEFSSTFDLIIRLKKQKKDTLGNINFNRVMGMTVGFNLFESEVVLGIEEDTVISSDALLFVNEMFQLYQFDRAFRGINLGSLELKTEKNTNTYSLLRYGLHGQAGALTRQTWRKIRLKDLLENISDEGWDSRIEYYLKSGFMVTPNSSRLLDRGWNGTHAPSDSMHPYFEKQRLSWIGNESSSQKNFQRNDQKHSWRQDAINYKRRHSIFYILRATSFGYAIFQGWKKLKFPKISPGKHK